MKRHLLKPGNQVGEDPRFTSDQWSSTSFEADGFSISYGQFLVEEDYVWQMEVKERSLVIMILLKGIMECRPVDKPVVWMGEDFYHLSYWKPGEPHLVRVSRGYCEMAVFEMNKHFIQQFVDRETLVRHNGRLASLPSIRGAFQIVRPMNMSMQHAIFHLIHSDYNSPALEDPERAYLQHLITLILEDSFKKDDPVMDDLLSYIEHNLHKPLSLGDLCSRMSMGSNYLRTRFKLTTGTSIRNYIVTMKMATAMELILNSELSISVIASEVGYDSLISFEKTFIRRFDYPPTYFREKRDNENQKV